MRIDHMPNTFFAIAFLALVGCAGVEPTKAELSLQDRVWAAARLESPELNPDTAFAIEEYPIEGLQEALGLRILQVHFLVDGERFKERVYADHDGQLIPFTTTFGGFGLMSAVVADDTLHYTYSWGSGIHRSHVGEMRVVDGQIQIQESDGHVHCDLFVRLEDGNVVVEEGDFHAFNDYSVKVKVVGSDDSR